MKSLNIDEKYNGKKVVQVLTSIYESLLVSRIYKAMRNKDIKVNGIRIKNDIILHTNDYVEIYIPEEAFATSSPVEIVFEDKNLIIVNKPQGIITYDSSASSNDLVSLLRDKYGNDVFPCHRIDRNTGGLVILARNKPTLEIIEDKIKKHEITKIYRCRVFGKLPKRSDTLNAYLSKSSKDSLVFINDEPVSGSVPITTKYYSISYDKNTKTSVCDIELVTGRTHQIRSHMAHIGHPIVGDGKYGTNIQNKSLDKKPKYQQLIAYKLVFSFTTPSRFLEYLKNEIFEIDPGI